MTENTKSSLTTTLLEIGPVAVFFLIFIWRKGETVVIGGHEYSSLIQATAIFVPLMIISTGTWVVAQWSFVKGAGADIGDGDCLWRFDGVSQ